MPDDLKVWVLLEVVDDLGISFMGNFRTREAAMTEAAYEVRVPGTPLPRLPWERIQNMDGDVDYWACTWVDDGDQISFHLHEADVRG